MPIFVGRDGVVIDRNRQRRRGLTAAGTPKAIAKSSEQKRSGFARDAGKSQQNGCQNAPIRGRHDDGNDGFPLASAKGHGTFAEGDRSEEHTSELQSRLHLVCRLLLEKKKNRTNVRRDMNL